MPIIDEYVNPVELTGFVREVPTPAQLVLNQYLPDKLIGNVEAAIDKLTKTNRAAKFRSWDAESPIAQRDSFQRSKIKLPPISEKIQVAEEERLMLERIRTGGDNRDAYVETIYDDAALLVGNVRRRVELARGDVLTDGVFTLSENGLFLTADFGVPSGNKVTAGTVWSDHDNASPLTDLKAWIQSYLDLNGEKPGRILTSTTVLNNLLLMGEIRELFFPAIAATSGPNLLTPGQLNQTFQAYGYPPITTYDTKVNVDGSNVRVIPDDRVILMPANAEDLGYTAWGITAESLELADSSNPGLAFTDLPGLVGVTLKDGDPVQTWTKVGGVVMPLITNPNLLMVADVL